ncbi:unnamed protein product [Protopolystoma xenopodis]|uniref:Uncharacterized protein n=1 Tax=Protopolystoma xenopodis TaxID=117903 RepID=A0A448WBT1_9PLAT|nr:unnamed protein product [Protopolystoma xenopodis]
MVTDSASYLQSQEHDFHVQQALAADLIARAGAQLDRIVGQSAVSGSFSKLAFTDSSNIASPPVTTTGSGSSVIGEVADLPEVIWQTLEQRQVNLKEATLELSDKITLAK